MTRRLSRRALLAAAAMLPLATAPALAQDKATVGALRFVSSGGLYLAFERGYFKDEKIDLEIKYFEAAQPVAVAIASGDTMFGLTGITGGSLNLAGKGALKIIASQGAEKKGFTGNILVAANDAHAKGLTTPAKFNGATVAMTQVGSTFHYQFGQIAAANGFELSKITMKPLQSIPNMVAAIKTNQVDGGILPPHIAGPMAAAGELKIISPMSDIADYQYGALFASPKVVADNRSLAERFVRAYVKGLKDYNDGVLRRGADGKRIFDAAAEKTAADIGKYVFPSDPPAVAAKKVFDSAVYLDPTGKLDVADIEKQIAWYKAEKLVDAGVDGKAFIDASFVR